LFAASLRYDSMRQKKYALSRLFLDQISVDIHGNSPEIYFNVQTIEKISITSRGSGMEQDSPWKDVVEDLFEEFLATFFPDIHKDIDFSKGYQFLDKELQKIIKSSKTGRRYADKLVKVYLRDGTEKWLLIHIEIQGYEEKEFPERMFTYNYRIFDKFRKEVISLALLTDENPNFRPNEYGYAGWGFQMLCRYPVVKLIDYRDRLPELETSTNPFAIVVRAYLKTLETVGNVKERYSWKKRFLLEVYRRGMKREKLLAVLKFIDWIMELPDKLETKLVEEVKQIEEKTKMPHMLSAERLGMKKGRAEGLAEGLANGLANGLADGLATIIEIKFGKAGRRLSKRAYQVKSSEALRKLMAKLKRVQSLPEAEKLFDAVEAQTREIV